MLVLAGCGGGGGAAPQDAIDVAISNTERPEAASTRISSEAEGDTATVTVTFEGLRDDSVRDERHVMTLERKGDPPKRGWRVIEDEVTYRCQPGRGHETFSPELCR